MKLKVYCKSEEAGTPTEWPRSKAPSGRFGSLNPRLWKCQREGGSSYLWKHSRTSVRAAELLMTPGQPGRLDFGMLRS